MGDFNIDLNDLQNLISTSLVENLQHFGFSQKIVSPTRHAKNSVPSFLDNFYANSKLIAESGNVTLNITHGSRMKFWN